MPKGAKSINYSIGGKDKFSFNQEDAASKTLSQFQEEQKHTGLSPEQLKEVWQLAKGTKEPEDITAGFLEAEPGSVVSADKTEKPKGKK